MRLALLLTTMGPWLNTHFFLILHSLLFLEIFRGSSVQRLLLLCGKWLLDLLTLLDIKEVKCRPFISSGCSDELLLGFERILLIQVLSSILVDKGGRIIADGGWRVEKWIFHCNYFLQIVLIIKSSWPDMINEVAYGWVVRIFMLLLLLIILRFLTFIRQHHRFNLLLLLFALVVFPPESLAFGQRQWHLFGRAVRRGRLRGAQRGWWGICETFLFAQSARRADHDLLLRVTFRAGPGDPCSIVCWNLISVLGWQASLVSYAAAVKLLGNLLLIWRFLLGWHSVSGR